MLAQSFIFLIVLHGCSSFCIFFFLEANKNHIQNSYGDNKHLLDLFAYSFFRLLLPALLANFCCTEMLLTFMADNIQCKSAKVEKCLDNETCKNVHRVMSISRPDFYDRGYSCQSLLQIILCSHG